MVHDELKTTIGARIEAIRQARVMSQHDLAEAFGLNRMTIHRWEDGKRVPDEKLSELAEHLRVPVDVLRKEHSEAGLVSDLLVQAGAVVEEAPRAVSADCPACFRFTVRFDVLSRLKSRVAVLCAPVIGQHQIRRFLAVVADLGLVHHVLLVSEEAPDRSAGWEIRKAESAPELHLVRRAELENQLFSLTALANAAATLADTLPSMVLEPRMAFLRGDAEARAVQSALWCWMTEQERPYHLVLVGAPGSGKTVSVRRFAASLARAFLESPEQRPCPVYIQLWSLLDAADLRHRLAQEIQEQLGLPTRAPVERALEAGRLVLILDGYDELVGRNPARLYTVERALELLLRLPGRVLMTARTPLFFSQDALEDAATDPRAARLTVRVATLLPLERQQVVAHLARLPDGGRKMLEIIRKNNLMEVAASPYVLDILFDGAPLYAHPFSEGQPVLFNLLSRRYQQWLQDDSGHFQRSSDELRRLLGGLAATLRRVGRVRGFRDDLSQDLREAIFPPASGVGLPPPRRSRFLQVDGDSFQFIHRRMEEFFFACWVSDNVSELDQEAIRCHWIDRHDLTLLTGMLRDRPVGTALLTWAADPLVGDDLRELSLYLLAFVGQRERATALLERLRASPEMSRHMDTLNFALAAVGDQREVSRCIDAALDPQPSRARRAARLELLSLGIHEDLLPNHVQRPVRTALLALDRDALRQELGEVAASGEETIASRAAALTALGYLGDHRSADFIKELLGAMALQGVPGRSPALLRLTVAARLALELLGLGRFPIHPNEKQDVA